MCEKSRRRPENGQERRGSEGGGARSVESGKGRCAQARAALLAHSGHRLMPIGPPPSASLSPLPLVLQHPPLLPPHNHRSWTALGPVLEHSAAFILGLRHKVTLVQATHDPDLLRVELHVFPRLLIRHPCLVLHSSQICRKLAADMSTSVFHKNCQPTSSSCAILNPADETGLSGTIRLDMGQQPLAAQVRRCVADLRMPIGSACHTSAE
ncbi:hypothetical protein C8Q80DRAFT_689296 [Daedaleopsis nitida]|nr:hypothetical protein C8Q80DRAFT_689296 [Daedaleopsis nitida]